MKVFLAHATGFCAGVWRPVAAGLGKKEVVAWDFAGHGAGPTIETPVDWGVFGEQVLDEAEPGGIGVGHSMGGTAMVMAQISDPARFRALVLIEPVIFPAPHQRRDHPLSEAAAKRKPTFETREAARVNFTSRSAFALWHPEALRGYVDCGLIGDGPVSLACAPALEADIYRGSNAHDTWERMGVIDIPVLILSGQDTDTIPPDLARAQAAQFPRAGFEVVPEAGHFLPMERPLLVAERVGRLLRAL
jgi:pimeloyl-ACP methyl ester carboxylesterase